jgi:glutamate dehydrogenase (NAD(P)+)
MAWIMDTYSMHRGYSVPAVVTGKPLTIGGSLGRAEATGRGVMFSLRKALDHLGVSMEGIRTAVQGFGKVGSVAARLLAEQGARIIAVSDAYGGVYNDRGLDIPSLLLHANENRTVTGFASADAITNAELLALDCDLLIPAALEKQITGENAPRVRAKIVAEAANGPTEPEADETLNDQGVFIIPDILCNAGGVIVSYFEWVQDLQQFFWDEREVNKQLEAIMDRAFDAVLQMHLEKGVDMRMAAYIRAIDRVDRAATIRGIYP